MAHGNFLEVPSYDGLQLGGNFIISGWFEGADNNSNARYFCRKNSLGLGGTYQSAAFGVQYDEIRLCSGSLSTARIKADYDMIANRKFCTYGAVKKGAE